MTRFFTPCNLLLAGLFVFLASVLLSPNPFGNNPDIIGDESYFLTSSLSALQKFTPPGLDFVQSGNYYGGPQTYLDTVVLAPVIGGIFIANHLSLVETELQIALHTGDLLAVLRFVTGLAVLLFIGFFSYYFTKRKIPSVLALQFLLLLFLLFGNSLIAGFVHTAKMWTLYMLLDIGIGILFITHEYYLMHFQEPFLEKNRYIALMVWAALLAFFQNYVGLFSILLWMGYAVLLGHLRVSEVVAYVRKRWYYLALFSLLQISFLYRAAFVKVHVHWWDPGIVSATTADNVVDWFHRLYNPLVFAIGSQPLVLLYVVGLVVALVCIRQKTALGAFRTRLYLAIACAHPVLVYLIFHVLFGFSLFPRYALPFVVALSFAVVMFAGHMKWLLRIGLVLAGALFVVVSIHSVWLYWSHSSDVLLTDTLESQYNASTTAFVILPDAWRLSLPLNAQSLSLLNTRRQSMSRFQFLLGHRELVDSQVRFTPLVLMPDTPQEIAADLGRIPAGMNVWTISTDCNALCTTEEMQKGSCFARNLAACNAVPQEINLLPQFLSYMQLGTSYVAHRLR